MSQIGRTKKCARHKEGRGSATGEGKKEARRSIAVAEKGYSRQVRGGRSTENNREEDSKEIPNSSEGKGRGGVGGGGGGGGGWLGVAWVTQFLDS